MGNSSYVRLRFTDAPTLMERLAKALHSVYQNEAARQSRMGADTIRHPDDYDALPEHTKDYDRALAIFILEEFASLNRVERVLDGLDVR